MQDLEANLVNDHRIGSPLSRNKQMAHLSWLCGRETDRPLTSSLFGDEYGATYNMLKAKSIVGVLSVLFTIMLSSHIAKAQSTIFNIPSTDVVAKKKVYFEFDFISHLAKHQNGGFQSYVPRVVVGVAKGLEAGVNVATTDIGGPKLVEVQPNIKWQFYSNEKSGVAATVGGLAYLPVKQRAAFANNNFGFIYANVSKKLKGMKGARFTG